MTPTRTLAIRFVLTISTLAAAAPALAQQLPPLPVPAANRITEAKRVLGKILFWDEQLSSDDSVACGTCHVPGSGGADPRAARNPGPDGVAGTADDIQGSFGVVRRDASGNAVDDPVFGFERQVTDRAAPSFFASLYARDTFWDGRASHVFTDPLNSQTVLIPDGGALESQSVAPILSSVEMGHDGRTWDEVVTKLAAVRPLRLADSLPADAAAAIVDARDYPSLFAAAFGNAQITPARIAFAIATYERTLLPNLTPWDRFIAGDTTAMTPAQVQGWNAFRTGATQCSRCHTPPLFTNNDFLNIGLRPAVEDIGRQTVSGLAEDFGDMKVPGLRNVGLRRTLMHTGGITGVTDALDFYLQARGHTFFTADQNTIPGNGNPLSSIRVSQNDRAAVIDFLSNGLTDPRAAAEEFPFDRPRLGSEMPAGIVRCTEVPFLNCSEPTAPGGAPLSITATTIKWKVGGLAGTSVDDFGDLRSSDGVALCLYSGADEQLVFEGRAPADGDCTDGTCWRSIGGGSGFRYSSSAGLSYGVRRISFKAASSGVAKLGVSLDDSAMAASPLGAPSLPMDVPLVVQLQSGSGSCWSVKYAAAVSNGSDAFSAR